MKKFMDIIPEKINMLVEREEKLIKIIEYKIEKNELLLKEKQFIFNSSHILDSNQIKLIEYIDHYISDVKK